MATVQLGALVMQGGPFTGGNGWWFTNLGDWDSIAASKADVNERPQANGAFGIAIDYRKSLPFSIKGAYIGNTHAEVQAAKRQLALAAASGLSTPITVTDVDGPLSRNASIRSVTIDDDHGNAAFIFAVDCVAPDPLKYGAVFTQSAGVPASGGGLVFPLNSGSAYIDFGADGSSGRLSVTNTGTATTYPTFTVSGGLSGGFVVTDVTAGKSIRFERTIPQGSQVTVNQRTGSAKIDGASDVSGFITSRGFFSIGPGETHIIQFSGLGTVTGTPTMTLTSAAAYW